MNRKSSLSFTVGGAALAALLVVACQGDEADSRRTETRSEALTGTVVPKPNLGRPFYVTKSATIRYLDVDGNETTGSASVSGTRQMFGCEYRLEYLGTSGNDDRGIFEIINDQGSPQRRYSSTCSWPSFVTTAALSQQEFDDQTAYYWAKQVRDYAIANLWVNDAAWPFSMNHANGAVEINIVEQSAFNNACWPLTTASGCFRKWPDQGPRIFLKRGHVDAGWVAHEYGHYAGGYSFGYMGALTFDFTNCNQLAFQEAVANSFERLALHSIRHAQAVAKYPVQSWHDDQWTAQCQSNPYATSDPLVQAFHQALWGVSHDGLTTVPWANEVVANQTMAAAFRYALASIVNDVEQLALAMLEWMDLYSGNPGVAAAVRTIFNNHLLGEAPNGAECATNTGCESEICDYNNGTPYRCIPTAGTGTYGEYCNHDSQCASAYICRGAQPLSNGTWSSGTCGHRLGLGATCNGNSQCASNFCDAGWGSSNTSTCVPAPFTGGIGDYCTHDSHCQYNLCAGLYQYSNGNWHPGTCADKLPLGQLCDGNHECGSGYCDSGWGSQGTDRCVPAPGSGTSGDYCTSHGHCSSNWCNNLYQYSSGNWHAGTCG